MLVCCFTASSCILEAAYELAVRRSLPTPGGTDRDALCALDIFLGLLLEHIFVSNPRQRAVHLKRCICLHTGVLQVG
jgi:hypothetical protein